MRIGVLGASGRTGRRVVQVALSRGHQVSVLVRKPKLFKGDAIKFVGDAKDPAAVARAIQGCAAVISCLGMRSRSEAVMRDGAKAMVAAMRREGLERCVVVSQGLLFPTTNPIVLLLRWLLSAHVADSCGMEAVVAATRLDWTVARAPRLSDQDAAREYVVADERRPDGPAAMRRVDLAAFLMDAVEQHAHVRRIVGITSR